MDITWFLVGALSIMHCAKGDFYKACSHPSDKGPFSNGTHYCVSCTYFYTNFNELQYAYKCGCNVWKPFYNGCCLKLDDPDRGVCSNNTVTPIFVKGPTLKPIRVVMSPEKHSADDVNKNIDTSVETTSKNYNKVIWAGTVFLLLITIAAIIKVYLCIRSRPATDKKMTLYRLDRVVTLDMNALVEQEV